MKVVSINVSLPVEVQNGDEMVSTGIFKKPVTGCVRVSKTNLAGDGQADLKNHGGENKAVYAYSYDHYPYWREVLGRPELPYGQFGENLTIEGLNEAECFLGDHLRIGSALFAITQPRVPCFKLGIRLGLKEMPKMFTRSALTGFYLKVLEEGEIEAGNSVEIVQRGAGNLPIKTLFSACYHRDYPDATNIMKRALEVPELSAEWRVHLTEWLSSNVSGS